MTSSPYDDVCARRHLNRFCRGAPLEYSQEARRWGCRSDSSLHLMTTLQIENARLRSCGGYLDAPFQLPIEALRRGVRSRSTNLYNVVDKLQTGTPLRIYAVGASVTSMFTRCTYRTCTERSTSPSPDFLVEWIARLRRTYPNASIVARTRAGGGMPLHAVTSCARSFLSPRPDVVVLDFAIYAGMRPNRELLDEYATLLAYLNRRHIVAILLNLGVWCLDASGRVGPTTFGHLRCQRAILGGNVTRTMRRLRDERPDLWHGELYEVARRYGHTTVSTADALGWMVRHASLRVEDFTHDGMHPIYWPWRGVEGRVYASYIAQLLHAALVGTTGVPSHAETWHTASPHAVGLRCYGARDSWGTSVVAKRTAWRHTRHDVVYDERRKVWSVDSSKSARPGYTSLHAGERMVMRVNAHRAHSVHVQYLRSYEHTGVVRVSCETGCECDARVDTRDPTQLHATLAVVVVPLTVDASRACECRLVFDNVSPTGSTHSKLKLASVSLFE